MVKFQGLIVGTIYRQTRCATCANEARTDVKLASYVLVATDPRMLLAIAWATRTSAGRRRSQHASWLELAVGGCFDRLDPGKNDQEKDRVYL